MHALSLMHPTMYRKESVRLPTNIVKQLKEVSRLSTKNKWEYAGGVSVNFNNNEYTFGNLSRTTSKKRSTVSLDDIESVWPNTITYHTHPGVALNDSVIDDHNEIFTTLPSNADFESFILGYPEMHTNIICDLHGYYVIDIFESFEKKNSPIPVCVSYTMGEFRKRPIINHKVFSEDNCEYFSTTIHDWRRIINFELNYHLRKKFGITIRYYGYGDIPGFVSIDRDNIG
jgi:hypothetical protein